MMLDHARENGVEVRTGATVEKAHFDGERATGITFTNGDGPATVRAEVVVVDASGRATLLGNQLDLKGEVPGLNKATLWGYYPGGKRLPGIDRTTRPIYGSRMRRHQVAL